MESLAHGNSVDEAAHIQRTRQQVAETDRRLERIINGDQLNQVSKYERPSAAERANGFCAVLSDTIDTINAKARGSSFPNELIYLMKCPPGVLESRENLVLQQVCIDYNGDGFWYVARVQRTENRAFIVRWRSGNETKVHLSHFSDSDDGKMTKNWRLLSLFSDLVSVDGVSSTM